LWLGGRKKEGWVIGKEFFPSLTESSILNGGSYNYHQLKKIIDN
jgi:hypothetical protein